MSLNPAPRRSRPAWVIPLLVAGLAGVVFWIHFPALSAKALLFDDEQYLIKNVLIQQPSWASTWRFLSEVLTPSTVGGYYQPLSMISLMLDFPFADGPFDTRPFHRTSLSLHVLNTLLVWWFLYSLFSGLNADSKTPHLAGRRPSGRQNPIASQNQNAMWPAALTALLFGVHPLTVEPIPWVGERKTLLATFFALICLVCYVRYVRSKSRAAYGGAIATFVFALLSKPTVTPLPLLLILLDLWPLRRFSRRSLLEKIPFLAIAGLSACITFASQARTAGVHLPRDYGLARIPLVLCHNIVFYLIKIVWPHDLSAHYPFPEPMSLSQPMMLAGAIGTAILLALLAVSLRWTRAAAVGWLFFFVAILPTMQIVGFSNVIASDKYAYFPSLGLCTLAVWLLLRLWNHRGGPSPIAARRFAIAAIVLLIAAAEARATRSYLSKWQDTQTLYRYMVTLAPKAPSLYNDLAADAERHGRYDEAVSRFRQALALAPDDGWYHNGLGGVYFKQGKIDEAEAEFRAALDCTPILPDVTNNLGLAMARKGQIDEAEAYFRQSISLRGEAPDVHHNLAALLLIKGKNEEAAREAGEALRIKPHYAEAHYNLGLAKARQQLLDEALRQFTETLRLNPDHVNARASLAEVLMAKSRWSEAAEQYQEVLRLQPNDERAFRGLQDATARQAATTQSSP